MNSNINRVLSITPYPQKAALLLGLHSDLNIKNPYAESRKINDNTWAESFYRAFERGRYLKKKHNFLIQKTIWN